MHKYFFFTVLIFCSTFSKLNVHDLVPNKVYSAKIENMEQSPLKVSLIIPCHPAHAKHLYRLLRMLEEQTVLPDEVIIALSQYELVPESIITQLEEGSWDFPVTLILSKERLYAGQNRNLGSMYAIGDVFVYQDADDWPHRQRVQIIKLLFQLYEIDHLMHKFTRIVKDTDVPMQLGNDVIYLFPFDYESQVPGKWVTNGNIAISRELFTRYQWPISGVGEDEYFNRMLYKQNVARLIVQNQLLIYRYHLSTCHKENTVLYAPLADQEGLYRDEGEYGTKILFNIPN